MKEPSTKSKPRRQMTSFDLDEEDKQAATSSAYRAQISLSAWIRQAVREKIKRETATA